MSVHGTTIWYILSKKYLERRTLLCNMNHRQGIRHTTFTLSLKHAMKSRESAYQEQWIKHSLGIQPKVVRENTFYF